MKKPNLLKAGVAAAAAIAVIAGAPMVANGQDDPSLAAMPVTWELEKELAADQAAPSHKSAVKVEEQRKEAVRKAKAKAKAEAKAKAKAEAEAKAKAEAAAKARAEKERQQANARAARSSQGGSPAQNRALGMQMCAARGWSSSQCADLGTLWQRESGWSSSAHNSSSGAHGIPQSLPGSKMASHGSDWATNPRTQIAWGLDYIAGRYGNPSSALAHSNSVGWY